MSRLATLRITAALLLVLATIVFVIGVMAERSVADEASETRSSVAVTASSNEQPGDTSEEGAESHNESEEAVGRQEDVHADEAAELHTGTDENSGTILGINVESTSTVATAVVISLLLAAALWFWGTPPTLVVAGAVALLFAALDLREVTHQLSEGRSGLVAVALLAAVLHAGAAVVAGLALTRPGASAGTSSLT
jgi:hypothetical protein